jgi:adenosylhomocysteine nucleosidase
MNRPAHVLIVTALKLERLAVREHLSDVSVEHESALATDTGVFRTGERELHVAVLQTGAGNVSAAIQTSRAEEFFRPGLVVMTGIAGGLKDVTINDVVASEKVYWIEGGKDTGDWHPRIDVAPVSDSLRQAARAIAATDSWRSRLATGESPEAWVAPIAAGEKVLASSRSEAVERIRKNCSDAVCVDMEDYGTLRAGAATERTRTISIRGISDLLDHKGEVEAKGSQPRAAASASAFTFELIAEYLQPPPELSQAELVEVFASLYPEGPGQRAIWERAGGDLAMLETTGTGRERWWRAVGQIIRGGAPQLPRLLDEMTVDFPHSDALRVSRQAEAE